MSRISTRECGGDGQGDDKHRMCSGKLITRNVFSKIDKRKEKRVMVL